MSRVIDTEIDILYNGIYLCCPEYAYKMSDSEKLTFMSNYHDAIQLLPDDFQMEYDGKKYTRANLLNNIFFYDGSTGSASREKECLQNFKDHFGLIIELTFCEYGYIFSYRLKHYNATYLDIDPKLNGNPQYKQVDLRRIVDYYQQFRTYEYFAYFEGLLENAKGMSPYGDVRYAVAQVFMQSFEEHGDADISTVFRMRGNLYQSCTYDIFEKFVSKDFEKIITDIHTFIKGTVCTQKDCINVIKKYGHQNQNRKTDYKQTLFYSDSPYIATSGYRNAFEPEDMKELIHALRDSGDKFIFSCRAVNKIRSGSKTEDERRRGNRTIFDAVFVEFIDAFAYEDDKKRQTLWVLAIESKKTIQGATLADQVERNLISEIMITNFEIHDFVDIDSAYSDTIFKVYEFSEFLKVLIVNANAEKEYPDIDFKNQPFDQALAALKALEERKKAIEANKKT